MQRNHPEFRNERGLNTKKRKLRDVGATVRKLTVPQETRRGRGEATRGKKRSDDFSEVTKDTDSLGPGRTVRTEQDKEKYPPPHLELEGHDRHEAENTAISLDLCAQPNNLSGTRMKQRCFQTNKC